MNLSAIGWPQGALGSGYPDAPKNLLPGRIEGWPQGTQSSANEAERLLSTAVAWWDADHYENGDKILRNRGMAGDLLNLRLGSSPRVATTNDPLFLEPEETGYVYLPGGSTSNNITVENITTGASNEYDLIARWAYDDYTPSSNQTVIASSAVDPNRAARLWIEGSSGRLRANVAKTGSAADGYVSMNSFTSIPLADGQAGWFRFTFRGDNGAGSCEGKFYTAPDSDNVPSSWTQFGSTQTDTALTLPTVTGQWNTSAAQQPSGKFHRAIVKDGIDGTTVLDVDCNALTDASQTSFQAVTGQTVTINRSSSGRKSVAMPNKYPQKTDNGWSRGKPLFLFGSDDYMQVIDEWQHQLLNFDAGDSFTVLGVARTWGQPNSLWRGFVTKGPSPSYAGGTGWSLLVGISGALRSRADDGSTNNDITNYETSLGDLAVGALIVDRASTEFSITANNVKNSEALNVSDLSTNKPVRVGWATFSGAAWADMEFTAAAVFRRALSPEEIATITDYYQTTAPGFQGEQEITAIDLLESSVFWIDANRSGVV